MMKYSFWVLTLILLANGCSKSVTPPGIAPSNSNSPPSGAVSAGDTVGNGGNEVAEEFVSVGYGVLSALRTLPENAALLSDIQIQKLEASLKDTRISVEGPFKDRWGDFVDGRVIDDPERPGKKRVELFAFTWWGLTMNQKYRFAFHEYLRAININDDNYIISSKLSIPDFSPKGRRPIHYVCDTLVGSPPVIPYKVVIGEVDPRIPGENLSPDVVGIRVLSLTYGEVDHAWGQFRALIIPDSGKMLSLALLRLIYNDQEKSTYSIAAGFLYLNAPGPDHLIAGEIGGDFQSGLLNASSKLTCHYGTYGLW
jgi:hypothetical protein